MFGHTVRIEEGDVDTCPCCGRESLHSMIDVASGGRLAYCAMVDCSYPHPHGEHWFTGWPAERTNRGG